MSTVPSSSQAPSRSAVDVEAVVIGAGFSGLYMLHRLRGLGLNVQVFEAGSGVGGTWFWNRYPGARCDIASLDYCYSFSEELLDEWQWSERYAPQPEVLRYLNYVADRFDLRRDVQLEAEVASAHYQSGDARWLITTEAGESFSARWCVMCVGCLSKVKRPEFPGLESFAGDWYHTAQWPKEGADFSGRRVAVIGTGSTAIQAIPQIARQAEQLYVFQRTPNYSMPAQNGPLDPELVHEVRRNYAERRRLAEMSDAGVPFPPPTKRALGVTPEERCRMYEAGWERGGINALSYAFTDFFTEPEANATAAQFARQKIREIVRDPDVADALRAQRVPSARHHFVNVGYFEGREPFPRPPGFPRKSP